MDLQMWRRRSLLAVVGLLAFLVSIETFVSSLHWIHRPFPGFFVYGNLAVAPDFLPHWGGSREGIRFLDRITAVEGRPVTRPLALYHFIQESPSGSRFRYLVERGGRRFEVVIPSMEFTFHDWLLSYGTYLLAGIGFLFIGFAPFYFGSTSPAAPPLFFMVSAIFVWFATTFDFMTGQVLPKELRIFAFTATPSAGIHLGLLLTRRREVRRRETSCLVVVYGISLLLGSLYSLTFDSRFETWLRVVRLSYGYAWIASVVFLGVLWMELARPLADLERLRFRVVGFGAFIGFFLPTLGTVLASSLHWELPYNLLLISSVFFPLSVAYALLKYHLFDLDVVIRAGITRSALTGGLLLLYIVLVALLHPFVGRLDQEPLVPLFFSILVVIVFNPLLRWIEGVVDRYLFRKEYDPIRLQSEVSLLLRSLSRPRLVAESYLKVVAAEMGIERASLLFRSAEKGPLSVSVGDGADRDMEIPPRLYSLWPEHAGAAGRGVLRGEVESDPACEGVRNQLLGVFEEVEAELLLPLTFEGEVVGFVALGKKCSGRSYSADDIRLLCLLADQLGLSLENSTLFEESEKSKENYRLLYDRAQIWNKKLMDGDRLKKQFVANISHELRTPISTILGYGEVLLDPGFRGDTRTILEKLVTNGQALSRLMDSLLDFSQVESGKMTISLREVKVRELLDSLATMMRKLLQGRPIRFSIQVDPFLEIVETDPKKLQQILLHLLTNALKFTKEGAIGLNVRSRVEHGNPFVEISVSDTGIGINPSEREVIFEEFRQLDGSSTRQYGGTGLGLGLCRKLAQSLGGRIDVESEFGQGSVFTLIFPSRRPEPLADAACAG